MPLPKNYKLPKLPGGWEYVNEDLPPDAPTALTGSEAKSQAGSVLREMFGPQKPDAQPSLMDTVLKPVATEAASWVVPTDPLGIGLFLASTMLTGGAAPMARVMGKVGSKMLPIAEEMGGTALRRILGMGAAGAGINAATGDNPISGAISGLTTQIGGEGIAKLTQFFRMNAQARDLAQTDPETLGKVVTQIIPGLKSMRSPRDFHAAFKKGGAQTVLSEGYQNDVNEIASKLGDNPLPSQVMNSIRTRPSSAPGQNPLLSGASQQQGAYSFNEINDTIKRLRYQGWNQDEAARGLTARDSREASKELEAELMTVLPPDLGEQYKTTQEMYARGQRIIGFLDDKDLMDKQGGLNIPKLQQKLKQEGYSVRDSFQMAADASDLEKALFRGSDTMAEDVPGQPGKLLGNLRVHFGFIPTFHPELPKVGQYAGQQPYGLSPFGGSQVMQMLKRGVAAKPNTLAADEN